MATTYLGHDLVLPAGRFASQIKARLALSGHGDVEALTQDILRLDNDGILELNELAVKAKVGTVMLATAATMSGAHTFSYNETINLLTRIKELEESELLTGEEIEQAAVKLIRGYSTKQRLNLLISMKPLFEDGSQFGNSSEIDNALAEHVANTQLRRLSWSDLLHISDGLPKTRLHKTLKTLTQLLLENHKYEEIRSLFESYYDGNHLLAADLKAFRQVLGDDQIVRLCQEKMRNNDGSLSIHRLQTEFGEQALLSEGFIQKVKDGLNDKRTVTAPTYWKNLYSYESNLIEDWPETLKLMIEFYDVAPIGYKPKASYGIVEFAVKHGMHHTLLEKAIDALQVALIRVAKDPDHGLASMNRSEVLSYASTNYLREPKRTFAYHCCLDICKELGLIEANNVIPDIKPSVITDLMHLHGELKQPFEIIKYYPQAKGLFLEHAMGL